MSTLITRSVFDDFSTLPSLGYVEPQNLHLPAPYFVGLREQVINYQASLLLSNSNPHSQSSLQERLKKDFQDAKITDTFQSTLVQTTPIRISLPTSSSKLLLQNEFTNLIRIQFPEEVLDDSLDFRIFFNHRIFFIKDRDHYANVYLDLKEYLVKSAARKEIRFFMEGIECDKQKTQFEESFKIYSPGHMFGLENDLLLIFSIFFKHLDDSLNALSGSSDIQNKIIESLKETLEINFTDRTFRAKFREIAEKTNNPLIRNCYNYLLKQRKSNYKIPPFSGSYPLSNWIYLYQQLILNLSTLLDLNTREKEAVNFVTSYNEPNLTPQYNNSKLILKNEVLIKRRDVFFANILHNILPTLKPTCPIVIMMGLAHFDGVVELLSKGREEMKLPAKLTQS